MFEERIETERLILRPFTVDDIEDAYQMNLDAEVSRYTHDGGVQTREKIDFLIRDILNKDYAKYGFGRFAVINKETNEFMGFSGLKYLSDEDEVDIGYRFKSKFWGKGFATESSVASLKFGFDSLKLDKIIAYTLPDNTGSIRVLEKLNFNLIKQFEEEGHLINKFELLRTDYKNE